MSNAIYNINVCRCRALILFFITLCCFVYSNTVCAKNESVRKERRAISEGNKLYENKKYNEAIKLYEQALKANPSSATATYNLGVSCLQLGIANTDTTAAKKFKDRGMQYMAAIAGMAATKPMLASRANYNMGNISFMSQDYQEAITYYKQALRLNPNDNQARRNLRIAQLKLQKNDNKDNKNKNNNQDKDKDKDKDKKQEQNKNKQQSPPQENQIDKQAANQILQAVENKENQTRARVNQGQDSRGAARSSRNW